jgi:hypothetical protein
VFVVLFRLARQQTPINTRVLCSHISQPSLEYENGRDTISRNRRAESRKIPEVVHLLFATEKRISRAQQTAELPITVFIGRPGLQISLTGKAQQMWASGTPAACDTARQSKNTAQRSAFFPLAFPQMLTFRDDLSRPRCL